MRSANLSATAFVAAALCALGVKSGHAASVNCTTPGDLQTAISGLSQGNTALTVSGTCTGGPFSIGLDNVALTGSGNPTISGQIDVFANHVTLTGLTVDGNGLGAFDGIVVQAGNSLVISGSTIKRWGGSGVTVQPNATLGMIGGVIETNGQNGITIMGGGSATIGSANNFSPSPVEITGNGGNGITLASHATGGLLTVNIHANGGNGGDISGGAALTVDGGAFADNTGDGLNVQDASSVVFSTTGSATDISGNGANGIELSGASYLDLDQASVQSNTTNGINANGSTLLVLGGTIGSNGGAGITLTTGSLKLHDTSITANAGGPALSLLFATAETRNLTISVPSTLGQPAISLTRSSILIDTGTVTGPNNANTIAAAATSSVLLHATSITANDATDATLLAADASVIESLGGNTIHNSGAGAPVITITNASSFHQVTGPLAHFTPAADNILGAGVVQVQSNIELGTGNATASTWTGGISVQQNSSFRMDGGMTITGAVPIQQGSNGFFNTQLGGTNTVSGTVSCPGSSSHIAAPTKVTPNVVIVSSGPGCYLF